MQKKKILKIVLPIIVLLIGAAVAVAFVLSRKAPPRVQSPPLGPLVRTFPVEVQDVTVTVTGHGTVSPKMEVELAAEVSGRVVGVSPHMVNGGFFRRGDLLVNIDPRDYELAVARAEADVARYTYELTRERQEADIARREWQILSRGSENNQISEPDEESLIFRGPQLKLAEANLDAARARLKEARLALERTSVKAPFNGRVKSESVDVGQYLTPGKVLALIYGTDSAEIVLPLPDEELRWFDTDMFGNSSGSRKAAVTIRTSFSGKVHEWAGRVIRTEGSIDSASRLVNVVVEVSDPYSSGKRSGSVPLTVGMFVEGEIKGRTLRQAAVIPRSALRNGDTVWLAMDTGVLEMRKVSAARVTEHNAYITAGLAQGDRAILSRIDAVTDGMKIRVAEDVAQGPDAGLSSAAGMDPGPAEAADPDGADNR